MRQHHFISYPTTDGPFPNPFLDDEWLNAMAQDSVIFLRDLFLKPNKDPDLKFKKPSDVPFCYTAIQSSECAFCILANRILKFDPPSEAHLEFALCEAARRSVRLAFYIQFEATHFPINYATKRLIEARLFVRLDEAKHCWRRRVLNKHSKALIDLRGIDEFQKGWPLPTLGAFISEGIYKLAPDQSHPNLGEIEELFELPTVSDVARLPNGFSEYESWANEALQFRRSTKGKKSLIRQADRRKIVDAFLSHCNQKLGLQTKLMRTHIWKLVGHKGDRQFQYWQSSNNKKTTATDDLNFSRIIGLAPDEFVDELRKKRLVD